MTNINNLKEICKCGHVRLNHGWELEEIKNSENYTNFKETKDKKCTVNDCSCEEFIFETENKI